MTNLTTHATRAHRRHRTATLAGVATLSATALTLNRHGFRAVFMLAAAPVGGQWLQRSERLRLRSG